MHTLRRVLSTGFLLSCVLAASARAQGGALQGNRQPIERADQLLAFREALANEIAVHAFADIQGALQHYRMYLMTEADSARLFAAVDRHLTGVTDAKVPGTEVGRLLGFRYEIEELRYRDDIVEVFTAMLRANTREKPDIWPARDVTLEAEAKLTPVTIAVWDQGIDVQLFPNRLYVNPGEVAGNRIDDDANGFVDDVHGAGFDEAGQPTTELLRPSPLTELQADAVVRWATGQADLRKVVDSPAARDYQRFFRELSPEELRALRRSVVQYLVWYSHGTEIADVAIRGNPAARLLTLVSREWSQDNDSTFASVDRARKTARAYQESVAYLKRQGARVANLSWGFTARDFETELRKLQPSGVAEERSQLARQLFTIHGDAITTAIASAPAILFVVTAGNESVDTRLIERFPANLSFPNVLTVGAVDHAGDETDFTSFGKVDVYANGLDRPVLLPGGRRAVISAGSVAAPEVVNLAGKLWALYPARASATSGTPSSRGPMKGTRNRRERSESSTRGGPSKSSLAALNAARDESRRADCRTGHGRLACHEFRPVSPLHAVQQAFAAGDRSRAQGCRAQPRMARSVLHEVVCAPSSCGQDAVEPDPQRVLIRRR